MKNFLIQSKEKRELEQLLIGMLKVLRAQEMAGIETISAQIEQEGLREVYRRIHKIGH